MLQIDINADLGFKNYSHGYAIGWIQYSAVKEILFDFKRIFLDEFIKYVQWNGCINIAVVEEWMIQIQNRT